MTSGDPTLQRPAKATHPTTTPKARRVRAILIGALSALAAIGIAYLAGRASLSARLRQTQAEVEAAKIAGSERAAQLETRAKDLERRVQLLEARRALHQALLALEERNFGIAQKHLQSAGQWLEKSQTSGGAAAALGKEIGAHKIVATEDVGAARAKLVAWAETIDRELL